MTRDVIVAVDLGASSGRVIAATVGDGRVELFEAHRFGNYPVQLADGLHWDPLRLFHEILAGLAAVHQRGDRVLSIGVDTWGCDIAWLDGDGRLLANPYHHRDNRNIAAAARVHQRITPADLYQRNGLQYLPFNTLYQLEAGRHEPAFAAAQTLLLMPDLICFWLTGEIAAEVTNASTTGLVDPRTRTWDGGLAEMVGVEQGLLPPLREPGARLGTISAAVAEATGLDALTPVVLVGSHDTASAVAAIPAGDEPFAYISSGTWSLVGVELEAPLLSEFGRLGGFTNEGGVDNKTRFLHNVMGLWLLNESLRQWEREGSPESIDRLLEEASVMPDGGPVFNVNDETFLSPGDMATRIATHCERAGRPIVGGRPGLVRAILDSLARAYAGTLRAASDLTGVTPRVLHVVGGGSQNELLCRLTADLCGLTVIAGPVEATAIGNVLVQARALGLIEGGLSSIRALVRASSSLKTYEPRPSLSATR